MVNGDCTLIQTPSRKNIVIDTGEEENIIAKYLLDRKIKTIDYLIISHFDSDHCANSIEILEKLKVKNLIISKQPQYSEIFEEIIELAMDKKTNIIQVEKGNIIRIDNDTYFEVLWPENNNLVEENKMNNNAIVTKLYYKNFSMLFTGDIEKEAESNLINQYKKTNKLNATILKVAHHGSNTSSSEEFIKLVNPQIALIGVGKNNKFGHPNEDVITRLEKYEIKIYRTDEMGEITVTVSSKGTIKKMDILKN